MKNNKNIILLVIAGAGAFYLFNRMKKKTDDAKDQNIKTKKQPTDEIDVAAQKIKNVKKDVSRVKAIAKKYVNPQNVKKALNFIKKVKPMNKKVNTRVKKK
jgi:hypothetical protein